MDITNISKVASRKRMNTDAEKLREKVSRETAKIIKLKVAQDTAYWDLKERLQQLAGAHERLQQNMLDVQMQHEAASAHYQSELRLRPDTLNKLHGTRDICDVLEDYGERLRRSVARCRADRAALGAAYELCGARVRRLAADAERARRDAARHRAAARREAERSGEALQQLGGARARCASLEETRRELATRLERADEARERTDEAAVAMRDDLARLMREFDAQSSDMKRTIARQEKELQEGADAAAAMRAALSAAQAAERGASERAERMSRELSEARSACDAKDDALQHLRNECQEATNTIDLLRKEQMTHVENIKHLKKVINDKNLHEKDIEADISSLKQYLCKLEADKLDVSEQLDKAVLECNAKTSAIDELTRDAQQLQRSLADLQAAFTCQREADAKRIDELTAADSAKQRELDANTGAIASLMAELKAEADARARADSALGAARRQADAERDAAAERAHLLDDAVQRLHAAARDKDAELGAQVAVILDMRAEKERLQERIQGMQNTIDNIQKELTGRLLAAGGKRPEPEPAELGPAELGPAELGPAELRPAELGPAAPPRPDDSALYTFLSDGSVDGDALDPREVRRHFAALARGVRPALRRHSAAQGSISLSQVKDDLKTKSRTFFKSKRLDSKLKKLKQTD